MGSQRGKKEEEKKQPNTNEIHSYCTQLGPFADLTSYQQWYQYWYQEPYEASMTRGCN
jgi:hypothetical protein